VPPVEPQSETLGQRIKRLRRERGLSLAKVVGGDFSRAFLNQVELGKAQPSTRLLRVIAGRLGTQIDYLLEGRLTDLDRELALERARLLMLRGYARRALAVLEGVTGNEWPLMTDVRLTRAEALMKTGKKQKAQEILDAERSVIYRHHDVQRRERLLKIERGERYSVGGGDVDRARDAHVRMAERAYRSGDSKGALEHYQAARTLMEI
jgi:transcriptional regulator with XRE-family HTH domain